MLRNVKRDARLATFSKMADGDRRSSERLEEGRYGMKELVSCGRPNAATAARAFGGFVAFVFAAWSIASFCNDSAVKTRSKAIREMARGGENAACAKYADGTLKVVGFPSLHKYVTYPKIVSKSGDMVYAAETLDIPGCEGKIIKRSRHMAVAVNHGSLDAWPLGVGRASTTTFVGEHAVCLQHAIDVLDGIVTCDSD